MDVAFETYATHIEQRFSEQAWRQLFERHFDAVHRFCVALADGRYGKAEELAQQVNVIAARRIYRFDAGQFAGSKIHYGLL